MSRPDKARPRAPSARKVRAARLLGDGKAKSRYQAMVRAGFSANTAKNPTANGYSDAELERIYRRHVGGLKSLEPLAREVLEEELRDRSNPGRGQLAGQTIKLVRDVAADEDQAGAKRLDRSRAYLIMTAHVLRALVAVQHPDRGGRYLRLLLPQIARWRADVEVLDTDPGSRRRFSRRVLGRIDRLLAALLVDPLDGNVEADR